MKSVFVIWEYEQGSPFDREEPLYPFYLSRFLAEQALKKLGLFARGATADNLAAIAGARQFGGNSLPLLPGLAGPLAGQETDAPTS